MNPKFKEDLQHRLQQLEAEINSRFVDVPESKKATQSSQWGFSTLNSLFTRIRIWFQQLSGIGKLVVLGIAVLFGLTILQAIFKLIAFLLSLALLALLVYLGYTFLVSSSHRSH